MGDASGLVATPLQTGCLLTTRWQLRMQRGRGSAQWNYEVAHGAQVITGLLGAKLMALMPFYCTDMAKVCLINLREHRSGLALAVQNYMGSGTGGVIAESLAIGIGAGGVAAGSEALCVGTSWVPILGEVDCVAALALGLSIGAIATIAPKVISGVSHSASRDMSHIYGPYEADPRFAELAEEGGKITDKGRIEAAGILQAERDGIVVSGSSKRGSRPDYDYSVEIKVEDPGDGRG